MSVQKASTKKRNNIKLPYIRHVRIEMYAWKANYVKYVNGQVLINFEHDKLGKIQGD